MKWIRWAAMAATVMAIGLVVATVAVVRPDSGSIRPANAATVTQPASNAEPQREAPSNETGDFQQLG
jgi:hypothetical protein